MGRAGRWTLSVMVWVVAYAGWSSLVGLVIAAVTGDKPRTLSVGTSAAMTVVGPIVPTLAALWFNDWGRDGFPTREERRAAAGVPREVQVVLQHPVVIEALPPDPALTAAPAAAPVAATSRAAGDVPGVPVVPAHPLGVPAPAVLAAVPGFPVAPLLRDDDRGSLQGG